MPTLFELVGIAILPIIGVILNAFSLKYFVGTGKFVEFRKIAYVKAVVNILFVISWLIYFYVGPIPSIPFFYFAGLLLIIISILLLKIIHDELYVKRGTIISLVPIIIGFSLLQREIEQIRELISNTYSAGLGFILAFNLIAVYFAILLYREMRGGSLIWLLTAIYVISIFAVSGLGVLATFLNLAGSLSDEGSFALSTAPLIIPDLVMLSMGAYYNKKVKPILEEILKERE